MDKADEKFSVDDSDSKKRIMKITITRVTPIKPSQIMVIKKKAAEEEFSADDKDQGQRLAEAYGFYKLAAINTINQLHGENFIDESKKILLTIQNLIN
jgi:hypothetical protein